MLGPGILPLSVPSRENASSTDHRRTVDQTVGNSTGGGNGNTTQKSSLASENKRKQKTQQERLSVVKKRIVSLILLADLAVVLCIVFQIVWLSSSLTEMFGVKTSSAAGYLHFDYHEAMETMWLGSYRYTYNSSTSSTCVLLRSPHDSYLVDEHHIRFLNEIQSRHIEFVVLTDVVGRVVASAGPSSAIGSVFDPDGIISTYNSTYFSSGVPAASSVMVPSSLFETMESVEFGPREDTSLGMGDDLPSWRDQPGGTLVQFTISPFHCGTSSPVGYLLMGKAITRRKYDAFSTVVNLQKGGISAIVAQSLDGTWTTATSFAWKTTADGLGSTPDLSVLYSDDEFQKFFGSPDYPVLSTITIEDTDYLVAAGPVPGTMLEGSSAPEPQQHARAVYLFGAPNAVVHHLVLTSISWQIPFAIFLFVMSWATLKFMFVKFIDPMQQLIDSVRNKRIQEFNEKVRVMRANKSVLISLITKAVIVQGVMAGLIFFNVNLLSNFVSEFSSATSEGAVMSQVSQSKLKDVSGFLKGWSGFDTLINPVAAGSFSISETAKLQDSATFLEVDSVSAVSLGSVVIASSHGPATSTIFPSMGMIEYMARQDPAVRAPTATTVTLTTDQVAIYSPSNASARDKGPKVARIIAIPVSNRTLVNGNLVFGNMIGAIFVVNVFSGKDTIWEHTLEVFKEGYFGLFVWNKVFRNFTTVSTVLKLPNSEELLYGVDLIGGARDVLTNGLTSAYTESGIFLERDVSISGQLYSASVVPLQSRNEPAFTDCVMNAYIVRGVDQSDWTNLLQTQIIIQVMVMAVEILANVLSLLLSYLPMRNFLKLLQRTFTVPSMSRHERVAMENKAAKMMAAQANNVPSPQDLSSWSHPDGGLSRNI